MEDVLVHMEKASVTAVCDDVRIPNLVEQRP